MAKEQESLRKNTFKKLYFLEYNRMKRLSSDLSW